MRTFHLLIDGNLVAGDMPLDVINPATEEVVASCARASQRQLDLAVDAAGRAFPGWAALPIAERRQRLLAIADIVAANADELAAVLTSEQGKPLADAKREVMGTAAFFRSLGALDLPVKVIEDSDTRHVEAHRTPLGVVAAIIPWNFPLLTIGFKLPPALLAGNTVVLKPAPTTPLATLLLAELIRDQLPPGVLNVVVDDNDLGNAITAHPGIRKVSFTGSIETGRRVMASASASLKRLTLELGGNDAAIVLEDADPTEIAPAIFRSAFYNSGQICLAIKRLYVHDAVYDAMLDALAKEASQWPVDDGTAQGARLGPVQNKQQYGKLKVLLDEGRAKGRIVHGGNVPDRAGYFIEPTIVADIEDGTRLVDDEQFGPILPVIRFSDEADAVARANRSEMGLGASVWSSNPARARALAMGLEAGTVWVNKHAELTPAVPFGGAKQSGIGLEFSEEGLWEFTQLKIVSTPPSSI